MGLGQPGPGFAYFLGASGETDHIQTRGLVDLFWRSCWHDFVSILFILFQYSLQIMRSLCQEDCDADVSIILRSRCQSECEGDVRMDAKPMSI